jgi:hypothetical protein
MSLQEYSSINARHSFDQSWTEFRENDGAVLQADVKCDHDEHFHLLFGVKDDFAPELVLAKTVEIWGEMNAEWLWSVGECTALG